VSLRRKKSGRASRMHTPLPAITGRRAGTRAQWIYRSSTRPHHESRQVPQFDFVPSCRAGAVGTESTLDSCVNKEKSARERLVKDWAQFPATETTICTQETARFSPSYVELLECLDMYR
jgi:hypothetical protein